MLWLDASTQQALPSSPAPKAVLKTLHAVLLHAAPAGPAVKQHQLTKQHPQSKQGGELVVQGGMQHTGGWSMLVIDTLLHTRWGGGGSAASSAAFGGGGGRAATDHCQRRSNLETPEVCCIPRSAAAAVLLPPGCCSCRAAAGALLQLQGCSRCAAAPPAAGALLHCCWSPAHVVKDSPHPQEPLLLGFSKMNSLLQEARRWWCVRPGRH